MEASLTWFNFFSLILITAVVYIILGFISKLIPQLFKRKSFTDRLTGILSRILEVYKPIALVVVLLAFVSINYEVHGILLLLFLVLAFTHIRRYFYGLLFKLNPLVNIGSNLVTGKFKGDIVKFLLFGVIVNEEDGNRFIPYTYIDKQGFSINHNDVVPIRSTIYIQNTVDTSQVLDLLFDNPIIDFSNKPTIRKIPNEDSLQLQVALVSGAKMESLIAYLTENKLQTSLTKN